MTISIVFILFITFGIGLPLTLWIVPKHNSLGRLGLSYLLGLGIFTMAMYLANLLGLKLTSLNNILLFLLFSLPLVILQQKNIRNYFSEIGKQVKNLRLALTEKIIIGVGSFFVVSSFINTLYWPVYIWDALTLYDFRARVFVETGFIKTALHALGGDYYFNYPLLTSLSHTIVYISGENNPQFLYSMFYVSLALIFYGQLKVFLNRNYSLFFTFMLLTVPRIYSQSLVAYTNLPYMVYFSIGTIYFYLWDKKRDIGYLIISAVLVGLSTWARSSEPFWLVIFGTAVLVSIFRKRILDVLIFSIIFFPIQQVWMNFRSYITSSGSTTVQITASLSRVFNIFNYSRWLEVINFLYKSIFLSWGPILLMFIFAVIYTLNSKVIYKVFLIYFMTISLLIFLVLGTYIFSFSFPDWSEIPDSAARVAMLYYPLLIYSIALITPYIFNQDEKQEEV